MILSNLFIFRFVPTTDHPPINPKMSVRISYVQLVVLLLVQAWAAIGLVWVSRLIPPLFAEIHQPSGHVAHESLWRELNNDHPGELLACVLFESSAVSLIRSRNARFRTPVQLKAALSTCLRSSRCRFIRAYNCCTSKVFVESMVSRQCLFACSSRRHACRRLQRSCAHTTTTTACSFASDEEVAQLLSIAQRTIEHSPQPLTARRKAQVCASQYAQTLRTAHASLRTA